MDMVEFRDAIALLEKEKNVSREVILDAIREGMLTAYKQTYKTDEGVEVILDYDDCKFTIIRSQEVVEEVFDPAIEISEDDARAIDDSFRIGDFVKSEVPSAEFGRIAASAAKNVMLQNIREVERKNVLEEFTALEKSVVTGVVQRFMGRNIIIDLGKADGTLSEREQIKNERLRQQDRVKVYIVEVKESKRGPKIFVSRTHPALVEKLFEEEVAEVREGIVEIKSIAREAGSRTKIAVYSENPDVDPVGACVGMNGSRVNAIVDELHNEKIDIINWDENPARLIENSLSPAKVISVLADADEHEAKVVVPDYQLSLAIGKEGQNARLAARLTGFKIDIKSETQAEEAGWFDAYDEYEENYDYEEYYDGEEYYDEDGNYIGPDFDEETGEYVDAGDAESDEALSAEETVGETSEEISDEVSDDVSGEDGEA